MNRVLELITNDDGRLSRSQIMLWAVYVLAVCLLLADIVRGDILGIPPEWMLLGLAVLAILDRTGARYLSMRIGIAEISVKDGAEHGKVDTRHSGGPVAACP